MESLLKSLFEFQKEVPIIYKSTEGYGYKYADLSAIFEIINPILRKNNLLITQLIEKDNLITILYHVTSGEKLTSTTKLLTDVKLAKMNDFQVFGSQLTYFRRYSLSAMLGLITDIDNDTSAEQINKPEKQWLDKNDIDKIVIRAKNKGLELKDLYNHYEISKEVKEILTTKF